MKESYFLRLEKIYNQLEEEFTSRSLNCGNCCVCCFSIGNDTFSFVEVAYICEKLISLYNLKPEELYKDICESSICPFCDLVNNKCAIYSFRPLVCRRWGLYVFETTGYIFKKCVYSDTVSIYPEEKKDLLPFEMDLSILNISYLSQFEDSFAEKIEGIKSCKNEKEKVIKNIKSFVNALRISPHKAPLHNLIGRECSKLGKFNRAGYYHQKAIEQDPLFDFAYYMKAINSYRLEKFSLAEEELKKGISINPGNINLRSFLIMLYVGEERYREALTEIEYLSSIYPYILERYSFLENIKYLAGINSIISEVE